LKTSKGLYPSRVQIPVPPPCITATKASLF